MKMCKKCRIRFDDELLRCPNCGELGNIKPKYLETPLRTIKKKQFLKTLEKDVMN